MKSSVLRVRRSPLGKRRGVLQAGPLRLPCVLGRTGTTIRKREGDGATPVGSHALLFAFRRDRRLADMRTTLPVRPARADQGWCDSPGHPAYNRVVRLPFAKGHETLQRADRLYDFVVVLDWNYRTRLRDRGSAIFLHIARPSYPPTQGCVALAPADMRRLAPLLRPGARLIVER